MGRSRCRSDAFADPTLLVAGRGALDHLGPGHHPWSEQTPAEPGHLPTVPDSLSDYQFAGLLRGTRTEIVQALGNTLPVPANAEIVLKGHIRPDAAHASGYRHALEGPFGDRTGYYNEQAEFPVFTVERITMRDQPIYHAT